MPNDPEIGAWPASTSPPYGTLNAPLNFQISATHKAVIQFTADGELKLGTGLTLDDLRDFIASGECPAYAGVMRFALRYLEGK